MQPGTNQERLSQDLPYSIKPVTLSFSITYPRAPQPFGEAQVWCVLTVSYLLGGCRGSLLSSIVETGGALGACCSHFTCGPGTALPSGALLALPSLPWCLSKGKNHEGERVIDLSSFFDFFLKHNQSTVTSFLLLAHYSDFHPYLKASSSKQ